VLSYIENELSVEHAELIELLYTIGSRRLKDENIVGLFEDVFSIDRFRPYVKQFETIQKIPKQTLVNDIYQKLLAYRRKCSIKQTMDIMQNIFDRIETQSYTSTKEVYDELKQTVIHVMEDVLDVIEQDSSEIMLLPNIRTKEIIKNLPLDEHIPLYSGVEKLDKITNGFQTSRVYIVSGITGTGKSTVLMNLTYYLAKNMELNTKLLEIKSKEWPDRIPVIMYVSNENTITESYNRLASIISGRYIDLNEPITDESAEIVTDFLMQHNVGIDIKYVPPYTISTFDLIHIMKTVERRDNVKIVALILDYMNRINSSTNQHTDLLRIKLGAIVDELKAISVRLHAYARFTGTLYFDDLSVEKIDLPNVAGIGGFEGNFVKKPGQRSQPRFVRGYPWRLYLLLDEIVGNKALYPEIQTAAQHTGSKPPHNNDQNGSSTSQIR